MAWVATALPYISAAASVGATIGESNAQEQIAEIEAAQLRKQAIADKATAVQQAKHERRRAELLNSRVKAISAASGFSVDSVDVQNVMSDIDAQGEYNALAALHSGYSSASSKNYAANLAKARGRSAKSSGYARATGTILEGIEARYA